MGKEFTKITAAVSRILCDWSLDHISRGSYNDCVDAGEVEELLKRIDEARRTDENPEIREEDATSDDMRGAVGRIVEAMMIRSRIEAIRAVIIGEDILQEMAQHPGVGDRTKRLMEDVETLRSLAASCETKSEL